MATGRLCLCSARWAADHRGELPARLQYDDEAEESEHNNGRRVVKVAVAVSWGIVQSISSVGVEQQKTMASGSVGKSPNSEELRMHTKNVTLLSFSTNHSSPAASTGWSPSLLQRHSKALFLSFSLLNLNVSTHYKRRQRLESFRNYVFSLDPHFPRLPRILEFLARNGNTATHPPCYCAFYNYALHDVIMALKVGCFFLHHF